MILFSSVMWLQRQVWRTILFCSRIRSSFHICSFWKLHFHATKIFHIELVVCIINHYFKVVVKLNIGLYKPTVYKVHPPIFRITARAIAPGSFSPNIMITSLIQFYGTCWWSMQRCWDLNPLSLGCESSALTTRSWLKY